MRERFTVANVNKYPVGTACFTAVVGSEREGRSLTVNLSDYLSIQGSEARYEEMETYADRWGMENI